MIWKLQTTFFKSIFNESVWISITIALKFIPKGPIDYKSALVQVMAWHRTGEKPLPELMLTQFTDAYITALGGNKITKSGRSFTGVWYIFISLLHFVRIHRKYSILYFETLPVVAKLLPKFIHSRLLPSTQSNFTEYKQDMVAVFYAPVNGKWVN